MAYIFHYSGHTLKECTGEAREKSGEFDQFASSSGVAMEKEFIFIRLCVLREASDDIIMTL